MTFVLVAKRQRKEDGEFEARLGHRVIPSKAETEAEELAQQLKVLGTLPKGHSSVPNTHVRQFTRSYRHSSRESNTLFWPLRTLIH